MTYLPPPAPEITYQNIDTLNVVVDEAFTITVSGENIGGSTADYGGIAVQVWQAYTVDVEVSESHVASGATAGQSVWWEGDTLGTLDLAQYLHVEPTWNSWTAGSTKTVDVTITPRQAGTYDIYTKMYLYDGSSYPRDPSGSTPNTDHQGEGTYHVGTVTVSDPPDTTPPPSPINLTATPSSWTNTNLFTIDWTNPSDPSGIAGAYFKLGSPPTYDTDGIYYTSKPFYVTATSQGGQSIYVWLQDGAGNSSYLNRRSTTLYYDGTSPTDGSLSASAGDGQVPLNWSGFSDATSGIGNYKVVRDTGGYPNSQCTNGTQVYLGSGNSTTDIGLTNGTTYYYRACATDNAGNISTGATDQATPQTGTIPITITTSPSGRQITVDGIDYPAPKTFNWIPDSDHTIGVSSPQSGGSGIQFIFSSWSNGRSQIQTITTPSSATTYTAYFTTQYQLTTFVNPSGAGSVSPDCSGGCWYDSGTIVTLTATANSDYTFSNWSGDLNESINPISLTMDAPKSVTANFTSVSPIIGYDQTSFTFTATEGGFNPSNRSLSIWNAGGGTLNWSANDDATWLDLNPTSGVNSGTVIVSVDISGLTTDIYNAAIEITAPGATNTPVNIPVSLTVSSAAILLVDDDDNSPDVQAFYTDTLTALGVTYQAWDTNNSDNNEPDTATLSSYSTVIWFTGDEFGGFAGPGAAGEASLGSFLDNGGCLFISSQDYLRDRGPTPTLFMTTYLGMASGTDDVGQTTVTGAGLPFSGLGPYTLFYPFSNFSDVISPDGTAELAFSGDAGDAAINKDAGGYRTVFFGFPFEALPTPTDQEQVMAAVLNYCAQSAGIGDVNGDESITIVDALFVARYAAGLSVSPFYPEAADVNCDSIINIVDALLIARYAAGLTVDSWCGI